MPGNEDYLDSLLKMAQQDIAPDSAINRVKQMAEEVEEAEEVIEEPAVEETVIDEPSLEEAPETTEEPLEIEDPGVIEEPVVVEEPIIEEPLADVEMPSEEDISDLLNSLGDITAEEPVAEDPVVTEETVSEEETISQDDIASLLESIGDISAEEPGTEEPVVAEEPAVEEPAVEETPADPNAMLSADQIAAMFESANSVEEPIVAEDTPVEELVIEEPAVEEAPVEEEPVSQDDISALLDSIGDISAEEPVAEEVPTVEEEPVVVEEPVAEEAPTDPNAMLSADDIAAMFAAANDAAEPAAEETPSVEEEPVVEEVTEEVEVPIEELPLDDVLTEEAAEEPVEEAAEGEEEAGGDLDLDALLEGLNEDDKAEAEAVEMTNTLDTIPGSDESMSDLSQDDIEKLLNDAKNVEPEPSPLEEVEVDMNDLSQLESLGVFDKDADISELGESSEELDEISSLLKTADSNDISLNEEDDLMNLLSLESQRQAEEEEASKKAESEAAVEAPQGKEKKKKKGKKKKGEIPADLEGEIDISALEDAIPEKKQSAFSKFISFMTASDEDAPANADGENGEFGFEGVQGENKEILDEIDKEGDKKGKKKPKKDKKAKKGAAKEGGDGGDDEGEGEEGGKKKKKPKKEKVKKEKKPKEEEPDNSKPLNKKNVRKIFIMAAMLLLLLMLFIKLVPAMMNRETARKAYYKGDYETTYTALFGEKLSEGDQLLFDRSEIILKMSHKYDAFQSYNKMGMRTEALDQLLQAVARYEEWLYIAEVCGCKDAFDAEYAKVVTALGVTYDLTLDRAKEINAMPTDLEYSLMVESIANHTEYIDPNEPLPEPFVPEPDPMEMNFEDVLPEEQL
ncbi:MAG: hypothetical protein J6X36_08870 [Lachnospiraceae bacterium]|nr:hypothetical protein [Lachnospiraceae bacterium]